MSLSVAAQLPAGVPYTRTIAAADIAERLCDANPGRIRWLLQNQGPGQVWFSPIQQKSGERRGILLVSGGAAIDTSLYSQGELWVIADTALTVVVFAQWGNA